MKNIVIAVLTIMCIVLAISHIKPGSSVMNDQQAKEYYEVIKNTYKVCNSSVREIPISTEEADEYIRETLEMRTYGQKLYSNLNEFDNLEITKVHYWLKNLETSVMSYCYFVTELEDEKSFLLVFLEEDINTGIFLLDRSFQD